MVVMTCVYTVATIFVCWANFSSAKASKKQLEEMKRQFDISNRPLIIAELIPDGLELLVLRISNHGRGAAMDVNVQLSEEWIDKWPGYSFKKNLKRLGTQSFVLGIGSYRDIHLGELGMKNTPNIEPLTGNIKYCFDGALFEKDIYFDLENYITFYSIKRDSDLSNRVKQNTEALESIDHTLNTLSNQLNKESSDESNPKK